MEVHPLKLAREAIERLGRLLTRAAGIPEDDHDNYFYSRAEEGHTSSRGKPISPPNPDTE